MKVTEMIINPTTSAQLTAYLLEDDPQLQNIQKRPAVLVFAGGGYYGCSPHEMEPVALAYVAEGFHAFTLQYSCGTEHQFPEPLEDAKNAMKIIKEHSGEWMVNAEKIIVAGFSAGGHLAAALANCEDAKPAALILGYPVITPGTCDVMAYPYPDVSKGVTSQTPPTFIFATRDDDTVAIRGCLIYAQKLDENGVPFSLHIFPHGRHGLSLGKSHTSMGYPSYVNATVSEWFGMSVSWIKDTLGDYPSDRMELVPVKETFDVYSIDVSMENLWACDLTKTAILSQIPALADETLLQTAFTYGMSLRNFSIISKGLATREVLEAVDANLRKISN